MKNVTHNMINNYKEITNQVCDDDLLEQSNFEKD